MKVFLDTNILLDVYLQRKGYESSLKILNAPHELISESVITIKTVFDIVYFLEEHLAAQNLRQLLLDLLNNNKLKPTNEEAVHDALESRFSDFEDAVQYFTVIQVPDLKAIVTRNKKDFRHSKIPVYTPEEFLKVA